MGRHRIPTAGRALIRSLLIAAQWFGYCAPGSPCHSGPMEVSAADVARMPAGNLRVPRAEFAAVWAAAEAHQEEQARRRVADWYGAGVVMTCRWVAGATVRPANGPWRPARSPVTERLNQAYEELIEAEYFAAERLAMRRPVPDWLAARPGWIEAVLATLDWSWRGSRRSPLEHRSDIAG